MSNFSCWYVGPSFPLAYSQAPWALFLWCSSYSLKMSQSTLGFAQLMTSMVQADCRLAPWEGGWDESQRCYGQAPKWPDHRSSCHGLSYLCPWRSTEQTGSRSPGFSWQVADHSEDSTKTHSLFTRAVLRVWRLLWTDAFLLYQLLLGWLWYPSLFFSFKALIES